MFFNDRNIPLYIEVFVLSWSYLVVLVSLAFTVLFLRLLGKNGEEERNSNGYSSL